MSLRELFCPKELATIAAFAGIEVSNPKVGGTEAIEYLKEIMNEKINEVEKHHQEGRVDYSGVSFLSKLVSNPQNIKEVIQKNRELLKELTVQHCINIGETYREHYS